MSRSALPAVSVLLVAGCAGPAAFTHAARPSGSLGPYYPPSPSGLPFYPATAWTEPTSTDLTSRGTARAEGPWLRVRVHVVDGARAPVTGALVELWNVNRHARYICEPGAPESDSGFLGFGRTTTDDAGLAEFLTVWPVSYSRYLLLRRPPHVHLRVQAPGRDDAYEIEVPASAPDAAPETRVDLELLP
jgi:protocatechuate 3,4-dioxygenase beta subunit